MKKILFSTLALFFSLAIPIAEAISLSLPTTTSLVEYVQGLYRLSLGLVAIVALVMIVFGAVEYTLLSGAAPNKKSDAKDRILSAIWGLLLLLGAYLILQTINPNLVNLEITGVNPLTQPPTATTTQPLCTHFKRSSLTVKPSNTASALLFMGPVASLAGMISIVSGAGITATIKIEGEGGNYGTFKEALKACKSYNWSSDTTKGYYYLFFNNKDRNDIVCQVFKEVELPTGKSIDLVEYIYKAGYMICTY